VKKNRPQNMGSSSGEKQGSINQQSRKRKEMARILTIM
jgi:hypothetical protein